jgi:hypothetical protein
MEGPIEPNMGPALTDVLLCMFESTGLRVILVIQQRFLIKETLHQVDSTG